MWRVIFSTYKKNRIGIIRAVPWSFMVSRIVTGITQIVFPYFIYYYFMNGNMNKEFGAYAEGADYMTYAINRIEKILADVKNRMNGEV